MHRTAGRVQGPGGPVPRQRISGSCSSQPGAADLTWGPGPEAIRISRGMLTCYRQDTSPASLKVSGRVSSIAMVRVPAGMGAARTAGMPQGCSWRRRDQADRTMSCHRHRRERQTSSSFRCHDSTAMPYAWLTTITATLSAPSRPLLE